MKANKVSLIYNTIAVLCLIYYIIAIILQKNLNTYYLGSSVFIAAFIGGFFHIKAFILQKSSFTEKEIAKNNLIALFFILYSVTIILLNIIFAVLEKNLSYYITSSMMLALFIGIMFSIKARIIKKLS